MELVREYAASQSERAFETLVSRHVNLVYSAALRQAGDPHQAEEISQAVFVILARKADSLGPNTILSGWLYRATRYAAADALKSRRRRQRREQEAYMQSTMEAASQDPVWQELSPLLDEAMAQLRDQDRDALVLRFFENKSLREVGDALGLQERAAQKRVMRGLEKLHAFFARRGIASTTAIIAGAVSANSIHAAPAGVALSAVAVAKGAAASGSTLTLIKGALKIMAWTKAKTAIVGGVAAVLATGTTTVVVKKFVSPNPQAIYESIFKHPDSSSMGKLEKAPPILIVRPTRYPNKGSGIWTTSGKGVCVGATLPDLIAWAYGGDPMRVILPEDAPKVNYDYLNTLPNPNNALRQEIEKQFGLVARREARPTDVLLLRASNPAKLNSFRTKGGRFACYGTGKGNVQIRCFTNAPLSLLAEQDVQGYFEKPCIDQTDPKARYDFTIQWEEPPGLTGEARRNVLRPVIEEQIHQLGLELAPAHESIEMLVVEKAN